MNTTHALNADQRLALSACRIAMERYLRQQELWSRDCHWYSQRTWRARGEQYGREGLATLTFEGSPLYRVLNMPWELREGFALGERLRQIAEEHGFWYELGYSWSLSLYEIR
jgi:hypothetical protein